MNFVELLQTITLCMRGSSEQKLDTIFRIMDYNHDGVVSLGEMVLFYKNMYKMTNSVRTEESIVMQVRELFQKADKDMSCGLTFEGPIFGGLLAFVVELLGCLVVWWSPCCTCAFTFVVARCVRGWCRVFGDVQVRQVLGRGDGDRIPGRHHEAVHHGVGRRR